MEELRLYQNLIGEKVIRHVDTFTEEGILYLNVELSNRELYLIRFGEHAPEKATQYVQDIIGKELSTVFYNSVYRVYRFLTTNSTVIIDFVANPNTY